MPLVSKPISFACRAERLARAGAGPDWLVVGPPSKTQGKAPDSNAGEEMTLGISSKLIWSYIFNTPFVNNARGNQTFGDQHAQLGGGVFVEFVVVVHTTSSKNNPHWRSNSGAKYSPIEALAQSLMPLTSRARVTRFPLLPKVSL